MVTRNDIVYDIFETLRARIGDDDEIDERQLETFVKDYRAEFLRQRFNRDPFTIDFSLVQPIHNLEVEKVDSSTIPEIGNTGKSLIKTKKTIPNTVRRHGYQGTLIHAGSPDIKGKSFTITDRRAAIEGGNGKFNRDEIFAFPYNNYLYMTSNGDAFKLIYYVNILGIFEDPEEAYIINQDSDYEYTGDENYYTTRDLKTFIVNSILKDKFNILVNQPLDRKDDGEHNLEK